MELAMPRLANFVDGAWIESSARGTQRVLNPATGATIAEVSRGDADDVERAVAAASAAFGDWSATTPKERGERLVELADAIDASTEALAQLESANVGKPLSMARDEVAFASDNLRFLAGAARCLQAQATGEYMGGYTSWLRREPVGVVGAIAPWNYPLMMAAWKIGPALAAGNTLVLKPAEATPLTTLLLAELASQILPAGVLNVVLGDGDAAGPAIARHPDVSILSFTGAVDTGREVSRVAAPTLKRLHLELGGKAPVVVLDDADVAAVAEGIKVAGFWNAGQECAAACRVLAAARVYEQLLEALVDAAEAIRVGDPAEGDEIEMGPMITASHRDRVLGFVDRAASRTGACVVTGGTRLQDDGYFVAPTVISDVEQGDEIVQREVFGPVVTVQRCPDYATALRWANDVEYGLCASVWTRDIGSALDASRRLRFGTVWINDHLPLISEMPWSGSKGSGNGVDMSAHALDGYTQLKHAMAKIG